MKRLHALIEVDRFGTATIIGLIECDILHGERLYSFIKELLECRMVNHNVSDETLIEYADELSRDLIVVDNNGNTYHMQWHIKMVSEE